MASVEVSEMRYNHPPLIPTLAVIAAGLLALHFLLGQFGAELP